jgi:hypothetical protein
MEDGRPDESTLPSGQPEPPSGQFTQKKKNLKKNKAKIAEKYSPNNFQNTYVYKIDILVQLAFQKYTKI